MKPIDMMHMSETSENAPRVELTGKVEGHRIHIKTFTEKQFGPLFHRDFFSFIQRDHPSKVDALRALHE